MSAAEQYSENLEVLRRAAKEIEASVQWNDFSKAIDGGVCPRSQEEYQARGGFPYKQASIRSCAFSPESIADGHFVNLVSHQLRLSIDHATLQGDIHEIDASDAYMTDRIDDPAIKALITGANVLSPPEVAGIWDYYNPVVMIGRGMPRYTLEGEKVPWRLVDGGVDRAWSAAPICRSYLIRCGAMVRFRRDEPLCAVEFDEEGLPYLQANLTYCWWVYKRIIIVNHRRK